LEFSSLLDVGGAEGYKAALIRSMFNVRVRSTDLSEEACKRAKEIFNVDGEPIDIHQLPYNDNEFDVVLCSETLEHVPDVQKATKELLRVCKKAVIITVPHEPIDVIENNKKENIPHAHIHSFNTESFNFVLPAISRVIPRKFHNPFFKTIANIADAMKIEKSPNHPDFLVYTYNFLVPLIKLIFCKRSVGVLVKLDDSIANLIPSYSGMSFILLKDATCYSSHPKKHISVPEVIDFNVPFHYL